jgi:hypothetical protein
MIHTAVLIVLSLLDECYKLHNMLLDNGDVDMVKRWVLSRHQRKVHW